MIDEGPRGGRQSHEETQEVLAALRRVRNRPPPSDPRSAGCVVAIIAIVALGLWVFVGPALALSGPALIGAGICLAVIGLVGVLVGLFGGGFVVGAVASDVEEAIGDLLAAHSVGDPDSLREAAIRILDGAHVSTGPTTVGTFETRRVAERLGDALPLVERVEGVLLEQNEIYPVFTTLRQRTDKSVR